jgi:2'-5' RNA ligase
MTRTFLAIELPDEVRAALAREIAHLARALPDVRWSDPAGMHLTLAFLGELDDARLADATAAAEEAAATATPFALQLVGLGSFGPPRSPRVLWAGVGGDLTRLLTLQERLASALDARGFPREQRPFAPHLTLARLKMPLPPAELAALPCLLSAPVVPVAWTVDAIAVMKSELLRSGARYTALGRATLGEPKDRDGR